VASVSPYLVATVAFAQEWLYENGLLCYCRGRELRILDLHRSAADETVVDLRKLAQKAFPEAHARHKYKITLLYYSHNIVSCIYSQIQHDQPGREDFLLVVNPLDGEIILSFRLESVSRLFVRNNDLFLYYGITTEPDDHGSEFWHIRGFDITARTWLCGRFRVPDVIGTDIGSTVCFQIFDGYFYGLSSHRSLDAIVVDWVSYYSCFRFPLAKDGFRKVEVLEPSQQLWRRDHTEGPIDDRWTFLRFFKDETTGQLKLTECRSEWLEGRIAARRTYYTTSINFDRPANYGTASDILATRTREGGAPRRRWPRDPHMVHPGDGNPAPAITPNKCPLSTYVAACQTFIDLVDDSSSLDPPGQKLRICGGTRRRWTPSELAQLSPPAAAEGEPEHETLLRQIDALYRHETGLSWPPSQNLAVADPALDALYAVLNPPGYVGNTHGSGDERSMVYATGNQAGGLKALVFVSWDPSIFLPGTPPYPGNLRIDRPGSWAHSNLPRPAAKASTEEKGKGVDAVGRHSTLQPDLASDPRAGLGPDTTAGEGIRGKQGSWRTFQPAKYREISRGYHFAL
jgi:hypothetical protein